MKKEIIIVLSLVLMFLIILSSFFSAAETAYTSVKPVKIQTELKKNTKTGKLLNRHIKSFGWTLSTILIGNNIVNIAASVLTSYLLGQVFVNTAMASIISVAVMTPIIVVLGEIIPKILARKYSFGYLKKIVFIMEIFHWIFLPLTYPISKINLNQGPTNTEKELKQILDMGRREGIIEKREATLTKNALDLDSKKVGDAFTEINNVVSIKSDASIAEAKSLFNFSGHSRIPVISGKKIMGIIHIKDIAFLKSGKIMDFIQKPPYISKNTILTKALEKMRLEQSHIAFVTKNNKTNVPVGIITLEDIIEELIGEIYDEHDNVDSVRELGLHKWTAEGNDTMGQLNEVVNIKFEHAKDDMTLNQWISSRINRRIKTNLIYTYKNQVKFKVISNKKGEETLFEITEK